LVIAAIRQDPAGDHAKQTDLETNMLAGMPMGRVGNPEAFANTMLWLCEGENTKDERSR
jgi:NAD(P)-dependent dehydrogenase (short-subunit alcohol dehydrogenase family)